MIKILKNNPFNFVNGLQISSSVIDYIVYFSIIIFFGVTRFVSIPSLFLSLVGAYFFLVVPYVVGQSICRFFESKLVDNFGKVSKYFVEWIIGVVLITVLLAFLQLLGWSSIIKAVDIIIVFASIVFNIITSFYVKNKNQFIITFTQPIKFLLISILVGISTVVIIKVFFLPIPGVGFNFDLPYTTYLATARFVDTGYVTLTWRLTEFVLAGTACNLLNLNPLYFLASAPFALMILYSSGLYLVSYRLLKKPKAALLAVFIGVFINVGFIPNSMFVDNLAYVYRSNTIIASLFPLSLLLMLKVKLKEKFDKTKSYLMFIFLFCATLSLYVFFNVSWVQVESLGLPVGYLGYVVFPIVTLSIFVFSISSCYLFKNKGFIFIISIFTTLLLMFSLTHSTEAVLYGLFLSLFILLNMLTMHYKKIFSSFVVFTTILFCILQARGVISRPLGLLTLTQPLSSAYSITGFSDKWTLLLATNNLYNEILFLVLFSFSVVFLLHEKSNDKLTFLSLTWAAILFYFLPELFTYRGYHVLTPLLGITFAYVIHEIGRRKVRFNGGLKKNALPD